MERKSLYKLPKTGNKTALGVHLSDDTLSYVALKATSDGIQILHFGDISIFNEGDDVSRESSLVRNLATLKNKIDIKKISIALPDSIATFFELSVHETNPILIKKNIQKEVERSIVKNGEPVIIQSENLFSEKGMTRVAVTVIPEQAVRRAHNLFRSTGFEPLYIGLASECIAQTVSPEGSELFLEINAYETTVSVLSKGALVLESRINIGTESFVDKLSIASGLSPDEIRESLFFQGLNAETGNNMLATLRPELRKITNEIEKMFLYWHIDCKKEKECKLRVITMFGIGALIPGFDSYIARALSLKVTIPELLSSIPTPDGRVPEMTRSEALTHMPALSLALQQLRLGK